MIRQPDTETSDRIHPAERAGGRGMAGTRRPARNQRARAARQALNLCEAELARLTRDSAGTPQGTSQTRLQQPRINVATTKAALLAAGLPPQVAAALRGRLRLIPEQEAGQ
jgi:hypothetical protein